MTLINAVVAADVEGKTGDIILHLKGNSEKPYGMQLRRGCVSTLIVTLVGLMQKSREKFGDPTDFQPATLTGVQQYRDPHGNSHLILLLDHGLPIPLALDEKSVADLQDALVKLRESGKLRQIQPLQ